MYVVVSVDPMELVPLRSAERTENRMVDEGYVWAEGLNGAINHGVHLGNSRESLGENLAQGQTREEATRHCWLGRLTPIGKVTAANDDESFDAVAPIRRPGKRLACGEATLEALDGASISEVEVLENFGGIPLAFPAPRQLLGRETLDGAGDVIL